MLDRVIEKVVFLLPFSRQTILFIRTTTPSKHCKHLNFEHRIALKDFETGRSIRLFCFFSDFDPRNPIILTPAAITRGPYKKKIIVKYMRFFLWCFIS